MKKTFGGLAVAVATAIVLSACTTRETTTRIVQPVAVAPAGTTIVVPDKDPDVIVDID